VLERSAEADDNSMAVVTVTIVPLAMTRTMAMTTATATPTGTAVVMAARTGQCSIPQHVSLSSGRGSIALLGIDSVFLDVAAHSSSNGRIPDGF